MYSTISLDFYLSPNFLVRMTMVCLANLHKRSDRQTHENNRDDPSLLDDCNTQEKLETMVMQNFWD